MKILLIRFVALLSFSFAVHASQDESPTVVPDLFSATYEADYGTFTLKATRTLRKLPNNHYQLYFKAHHWLGKIDEVSEFDIDQEGQLIPHLYTYSRTGLGRNRSAILNFDWDKKRVSNNVQNKEWSMDLPVNALDKLSYQLQLRTDLLNNKVEMEYKVADGGHTKVYDFEIMGEELLDTPVGKLKAVKVKRMRRNNSRVTYLWLALDWNHLLVRLQQKEKDGKTYEINLTEAQLNGKTIIGS